MFLIIWHFETDEACVEEFKRAYDAEGVWAQLFRQSSGYLRTHLANDVNASFSFFTLDYWKTVQDFQDFKNSHAEEYRRLDRLCESLTKRETKIGEFTIED
ncbi:MAG: antibiotic biosynthesis monooxygenase family protein [bacterium]